MGRAWLALLTLWVCVIYDRNDEYTLRWLTDDGLQRLTQSRRETSSSSTDDDLDDGGSVEWALLGQQNLMVR